MKTLEAAVISLAHFDSSQKWQPLTKEYRPNAHKNFIESYPSKWLDFIGLSNIFQKSAKQRLCRKRLIFCIDFTCGYQSINGEKQWWLSNTHSGEKTRLFYFRCGLKTYDNKAIYSTRKKTGSFNCYYFTVHCNSNLTFTLFCRIITTKMQLSASKSLKIVEIVWNAIVFLFCLCMVLCPLSVF